MKFNNERASLYVSMAALVISVVAVSVSVVVYVGTTSSVVQVGVWPHFDQRNFVFIETGDSANPVGYTGDFAASIANVGNAATTITQVNVYAARPIDTTRVTDPIDAMNTTTFRIAAGNRLLVPQLISAAGDPVSFPIVLDPRHAVQMTVKLRIPIPRDLWAQVEEDVPLYEPVSRDDLGRILNNRGIADWGQIARMQGSLVVTPRYRYFVLEVIKEDGTLIRAAFGTEFSPGVKREGFSSPSVL